MCRLLGWATRTPTSLHRLLGHDDSRRLHRALRASTATAGAWPAAFRAAWRCASARTPPAMSDDFALWSRATRSDLGLVHLRWATLGLPGAAREHAPVHRRPAWRSRTTGRCSPPPALDCAPSPRRRRGCEPATTDSERYFLAVLSQLEDGATPAEALRAAVAGIAATASFTSLNCLLLTPDVLYAVCCFDPDGRCRPMRRRTTTTSGFRTTEDAVVVSSSGWGRGWQGLANGELLVRPPGHARGDGRSPRRGVGPRLSRRRQPPRSTAVRLGRHRVSPLPPRAAHVAGLPADVIPRAPSAEHGSPGCTTGTEAGAGGGGGAASGAGVGAASPVPVGEALSATVSGVSLADGCTARLPAWHRGQGPAERRSRRDDRRGRQLDPLRGARGAPVNPAHEAVSTARAATTRSAPTPAPILSTTHRSGAGVTGCRPFGGISSSDVSSFCTVGRSLLFLPALSRLSSPQVRSRGRPSSRESTRVACVPGAGSLCASGWARGRGVLRGRGHRGRRRPGWPGSPARSSRSGWPPAGTRSPRSARSTGGGRGARRARGARRPAHPPLARAGHHRASERAASLRCPLRHRPPTASAATPPIWRWITAETREP